jgi:penicillin amidase
MATTVPDVSAVRQHFRWRLVLVLLLGAILLVALAGGASLYFVARSALPQLDGRLSIPGLSARVTVTRDGHGVPTIEATSLEDLLFAQGYVTAQDRLWQMDTMRRYAAGELAEILGEDLVKHDREQRILGLRAAAKRAIEVASPQQRDRFEAYARGVNAFIASHRDRLPLEFRILGYSPRPWTAEDSALIGAQMIEDLNHGPYEEALAREKILAKLGPELTGDLYVSSSWRDRPPTEAPADLEANPKGADDNNDEDDEDSGADSSVTFLRRPGAPSPELSDPFQVVGSNNWVVSGAHTVSGKPLLANDMHLPHQMPNLWYEAHLRCGGLDVAGVTLPGVPYVIVGHNQRIAWGFTNVGPTVEDVYVETFNPSGQYLSPEGWKQPEHRQEIIHVKNKPDVMVDVVSTRHGPIITDLVPGEARKLALRWTLYDGIRNDVFEVDAAQNWEQFRRAFSQFDAPGQNVVYADVDGNIGYQTTGKVPIRAAGDGSLPVSGSDDAHEWTGYIPFDKLPSILNPPSGIIATANGRITPNKYPFSISTGWESPWRTARIYRVLESGKKFAPADMLALQTDIYSDWERYSAERLVYAVDHAKKASPRAQQAADILRNWDGRMTAASAAPSIAYQARRELIRLLLEPRLGTASKEPEQQPASLNWKTYRWPMQSVWLENILLHQPKRWLAEAYPNYDQLLTAAVEAAVSGSDAPKDLNSWKWGHVNPVEIQHPIFGRIPILQYWAGPGLHEQSGSGYTVKAVTRHHGPSERMTVDLSNLDQSTLSLVTGQASNLLSPYYMDQWKAWYEGSTFPLPFSPEAVDKAKAHMLVLEPGK